jgi:hypothetical protein
MKTTTKCFDSVTNYAVIGNLKLGPFKIYAIFITISFEIMNSFA